MFRTSLTPEGEAARDAENYLTNYHYVFSGNIPVVNWFAMGVVATPLWQGVRIYENYNGMQLHSPASWSAAAAGYQGANDAFRDRALGQGKCSCGQ